MGKVIQFPREYREREDKVFNYTCSDEELEKEYADYYNNYNSNTNESEYVLGLDYAIGEDGRIINIW